MAKDWLEYEMSLEETVRNLRAEVEELTNEAESAYADGYADGHSMGYSEGYNDGYESVELD